MRSETILPCREQPRLSCNHRANVADISHSEIKANRVRALTAVQHCSTGKIDMQIYAQILVILLTRPCSPCNGSTGGWHTPVDTVAPFAPLIHPISFSSLSFFLSLSVCIVSLYHSVCDAHFSSENTFFPSRRALVARCAAGLRQRGLMGVDG